MVKAAQVRVQKLESELESMIMQLHNECGTIRHNQQHDAGRGERSGHGVDGAARG